jgi:hypothetical protein
MLAHKLSLKSNVILNYLIYFVQFIMMIKRQEILIYWPTSHRDRVVFTRGAGDDWSREPREVIMYTLPSRTTGAGMEPRAISGQDEHTLPTTTREGQDVGGDRAIPLPLYIPLAGICIAGLLFLRTRGDIMAFYRALWEDPEALEIIGNRTRG